MKTIVKHCPKLVNLVLANCPLITDVAMSEIATNLSAVRYELFTDVFYHKRSALYWKYSAISGCGLCLNHLKRISKTCWSSVGSILQ